MKKIWKIIYILSILCILFLMYLYKDSSIAVLGYHNIYDKNIDGNIDNQYSIEKQKFEEQMKYLKTHNYKTLSLQEFYNWKVNKHNYGRKTVLITFDDGYYYNYKYAFSILKKYNLKATVFFIGAYAKGNDNIINNKINSYLSLDTIKKCREEYPNIEFASHTYNLHEGIDIKSLSYEDIDADIKKFNQMYNTKFLAYPHGANTKEFKQALKDNGYLMSFGFDENNHRKVKIKDDNFDIPRLNISSDMSLKKFALRINMPF